MIMDTMKSFNVKNIMYVAAFMAVTSMAQAAEPESAGNDTPTTVKEKKSIFEQAQGKVSRFAERARKKINGNEEKATEKVTAKEEEANEKIGRVSTAVGRGIERLGKAAACVRKHQLKFKIGTANEVIEQAEAVKSFLEKRIKNLEDEIKEQKENVGKFGNELGALEMQCPNSSNGNVQDEGEGETEKK